MSPENNHLTGWPLFRRIREVESALQLNVIRLIAIVTFFTIHLVNYLTMDNNKSHYQLHNILYLRLWLQLFLFYQPLQEIQKR